MEVAEIQISFSLVETRMDRGRNDYITGTLSECLMFGK